MFMLAKCREIALESEIPSRIVNFLSNGNLGTSTPQSSQCQRRVFVGKERLAQTSVIASLFVVKSGRLWLKLSTPPPSTTASTPPVHLQPPPTPQSIDFVLDTPTFIGIFTTAADFSSLPFLLASQQEPISSTKTLSDTLSG